MPIIQDAKSRLMNRLLPRGLILMYHRIADPELDPWGLCVSPRHFGEQLDVIRKYFHPLSLQDLLRGIENGRVPNRSIVVTFDDGYADNLHHAKPLLEKYGVPATIYLVAEALAEQRNFWWDELEWILMQPGTLPASLELNLNGRRHSWQLGNARQYSMQERKQDCQRRPWDAAPGTRLAFFYLIWQHLQKLPRLERLEALDAIRIWAGMNESDRREHRILTKEEAHTLGEGPLIELGAHTMTHPSLKTLSAANQMEEIEGSKVKLEKLLDRPVTNFSYPHGEYSAQTIELVRRAGFRTATTTNFRCVMRHTDRFQLPRFQVDNWNGKEFLGQLAKWYALF